MPAIASVSSLFRLSRSFRTGCAFASIALFIALAAPAWSQSDEQSHRWRRTRFQQMASPTLQIGNATRGEERTFFADQTQISGRVRKWSPAGMYRDVDWIARYQEPPLLISVSKPLEFRINGSITPRLPMQALHVFLGAQVFSIRGGQENRHAKDVPTIDLHDNQKSQSSVLRFSPGQGTPTTFFVRVHEGQFAASESKVWAMWEYRREDVDEGGSGEGGSGEGGSGEGGSGEGGSAEGGSGEGGSAEGGSGEGGSGEGGSGEGGSGGGGSGEGGSGGGGSGGGGSGGSQAGRIIQADHYEVDQNALIWVPIRLLRPAGVANMNYDLTYNAGVARVEGESTAGNLLASGGIFSGNSKRSGLIRLGFAANVGFNRDGTVAEVPFRAVGRPGSRTALDIEVTVVQDANGTTLPIGRIDGEILIRDPDEQRPGDYDCDAQAGLTVADAQCALDMSVGLRAEVLRVDVDGDGRVTSGDAREILQLVVRGGSQ